MRHEAIARDVKGDFDALQRREDAGSRDTRSRWSPALCNVLDVLSQESVLRREAERKAAEAEAARTGPAVPSPSELTSLRRFLPV